MREQVIPVLGDLVEVCRNGEQGFREAATVVREPHLATIFGEFSEQREQFAAQLRYEISKLGRKPHNHGTLAGTLHRRWIELRSVVSSDHDRAVVAECRRGDEQALRAYRVALREDLPDDVRHLIESQEAQIRVAYERLKGLEQRLRQEPAY